MSLVPRKKKIRVWRIPDGRFAVDAGMIAGRRGRTECSTEEEAREKAEEYRRAYEKSRRDGQSLTSSRRDVAAEAIHVLEDGGYSSDDLIKAAKEFVRNHSRDPQAVSGKFEEVAERLLQKWTNKENHGGSYNEKYVRNRGGLVRAAAAYFRERNVGDIRRKEFRKWIGIAKTEETFKTRRAALSAVFTQAIDDEILESNPALNIEVPRTLIDNSLPAFLEPGAMAYVLEVVRVHRPSALPVWLFQAFGAGRSDELTKKNGLRWEHVHAHSNPTHRFIEYPYGIAAKRGRERRVEMQDNLYAWYQYLGAPTEGAIRQPNHHRHEIFVRKLMKAMLGVWTTEWDNALRHSYATYRLPFIPSESLDTLGREMGNKRGVLSGHYDGRLMGATVEARQKIANVYWAIRPENCRKMALKWVKSKGFTPEEAGLV